jgi:hypothetical protein
MLEQLQELGFKYDQLDKDGHVFVFYKKRYPQDVYVTYITDGTFHLIVGRAKKILAIKDINQFNKLDKALSESLIDFKGYKALE